MSNHQSGDNDEPPIAPLGFPEEKPLELPPDEPDEGNVQPPPETPSIEPPSEIPPVEAPQELPPLGEQTQL